MSEISPLEELDADAQDNIEELKTIAKEIAQIQGATKANVIDSMITKLIVDTSKKPTEAIGRTFTIRNMIDKETRKAEANNNLRRPNLGDLDE